MTIWKQRKSALCPPALMWRLVVWLCCINHLFLSFFFFSENAQDVVQHILDLLLDATLDMKELETIANKISDVVNLEDISVTLAEDVLTILNYILLQETEDKNIRKMTNM